MLSVQALARTPRVLCFTALVATIPEIAAAQASTTERAPAGTAVALATATPASVAPASRVLRVCGDPDNLPFSNERQEGFENRIASLLAKELGDSLEYLWWPHRRGFVRNTLRARECDVIVGVPQGFDPVSATRPYYRSAYVAVTRHDRNLHITSLEDTLLRHLRIGVNIIGYDYTNTPPAQALAKQQVGSMVGYGTFYDDQRRPEDIVNAVVHGDVDVALVWGPLAGYFASRASVPLDVTPLPAVDAPSGIPLAFDIVVGVRHADKALRAALDTAVARHQDEIAHILADYHVPTLTTP